MFWGTGYSMQYKPENNNWNNCETVDDLDDFPLFNGVNHQKIHYFSKDWAEQSGQEYYFDWFDVSFDFELFQQG